MDVRILGCGTSSGVPRVGNDWGSCDPANPKNRRQRCSLLVRRLASEPDGEPTTVVVDTSPDFRNQALAAQIRRVDAVLFTHDHADQANGIDDLRVFAMRSRRRTPCYMEPYTRSSLEQRFWYVFNDQAGYPAICDAVDLPPYGQAFTIDGPSGSVPVQTFPQVHGPITSVGYRFGGLAYSSDVSDLSDEAFDALRDLDLWIVDALRWTPHPTHAHVDKALSWIERARPKRAILTNLHLDLDYDALSAALPTGVEVAFDGMRIELPS